MTKTVLLIAALGTCIALTACREEEQNRQTYFEKGVYLGPQDETLSEEQNAKLKQRALHQSF